MDIVRHLNPTDSLEAMARRDEGMWGTIVLDFDTVYRVVGAGEDEMDCYWIVESKAGPHTRHWRSMVGRLTQLDGKIDPEDMAYLESVFAHNGSPKPTTFLLIGHPTPEVAP